MTPAEYLATYHDIRPYCGCDLPPGWFALVRQLVVQLELRGGWDPRCVSQIKEKLGGLRFYDDNQSPHCWEIADKAEALSFKTCCRCGMDGTLINHNGWWLTVCRQCWEPVTCST